MRLEASKYSGFEWDAGNLTKSITKHGVSPQEAEQVFGNEPLLVQADVKHSQSEWRGCAWGKTDQGRRLSVVFTVRGDKIRVISARLMNRKERMMYAKSQS